MNYVGPNNIDIVISVWAALHVVEAKSMQQLVYDSTVSEATASDRMPTGQVQHLVSTLITHLRKTTSSITLQHKKVLRKSSNRAIHSYIMLCATISLCHLNFMFKIKAGFYISNYLGTPVTLTRNGFKLKFSLYFFRCCPIPLISHVSWMRLQTHTLTYTK